MPAEGGTFKGQIQIRRNGVGKFHGDVVTSMGVSQHAATWAGTGGGSGHGVVVAILDTGINDAADGLYPGHEAVLGRRVGGAEFTHADSLLDTPRDAPAEYHDLIRDYFTR